MSRSRKLALASLLIVALSLPATALAQGGTPPGGGTPTGTTGTGPTRGTTGAIPSITTVPSTQQQRQQEGPIFLSGQVVLEDGTPPPSGVSIERVCNGQARREAYTDSKGQFGFQIGQTNAVFQDASISNPNVGGMGGSASGNMNLDPLSSGRFGDNGLLGCDLRASLAGYHSDYLNLSNHQRLDNPNVGTIVLHRLGKVEGTTISVTTMQAPKEARRALDSGNKALKKDKLPDAEVEFRKAVEMYPKFAEAWTQLGLVCEKEDRAEEARKAFNAALAADPKFLRPYFGLIDLASATSDWKEVAALSDKALALNGYEYPNLYFYNSIANYNLQNFDVAEKNARNARRLDSQHHIPRIDLLLGDILAMRKDYAGAAEQFRTFLKFSGAGPETETAKAQLQKLEQLTGKPPSPDTPK